MLWWLKIRDISVHWEHLTFEFLASSWMRFSCRSQASVVMPVHKVTRETCQRESGNPPKTRPAQVWEEETGRLLSAIDFVSRENLQPRTNGLASWVDNRTSWCIVSLFLGPPRRSLADTPYTWEFPCSSSPPTDVKHQTLLITQWIWTQGILWPQQFYHDFFLQI